ncbi:MAG: hypothetical protein GQ582_12190, partial [Methyloprofundus sp.]|nr:hypothetical protein [Methyloprofundus sp.]
DLTIDKIWKEKLKDTWVQSWVHAGMLVFANELLKMPRHHNEIRGLLFKDWPESLGSPEELDISPALKALQSEDSILLMVLGKLILYAYLTHKGCLVHKENNGYIKLRFKDSVTSH